VVVVLDDHSVLVAKIFASPDCRCIARRSVVIICLLALLLFAVPFLLVLFAFAAPGPRWLCREGRGKDRYSGDQKKQDQIRLQG